LISQRCNHWEWRNEIPITKKPPRDDLTAAFLRTQEIDTLETVFGYLNSALGYATNRLVSKLNK
jgi:hypothetical protein